MEVRKFEAPTIAEALESIKKELGPEAIILETKKNKKGFGLMSGPSVEITAAVTKNQLSKKNFAERNLNEDQKKKLHSAPVAEQKKVLDKYMDSYLSRMAKTKKDLVEIKSEKIAEPEKNQTAITKKRYVDIDEPVQRVVSSARSKLKKALHAFSTSAETKEAPVHHEVLDPNTLDISIPSNISESHVMMSRNASFEVQEEVRRLREEIATLRRQRESEKEENLRKSNVPQVTFDSDELQDAFDLLVIHGMDRRFAMNLIKRVQDGLEPEILHDIDGIQDRIAKQIYEEVQTEFPFEGITNDRSRPQIFALIGPSGTGKTMTVGKMAYMASEKMGLNVGLISISNSRRKEGGGLEDFAKILGLPFRKVSDRNEFLAALKDYSRKSVVLVDTDGVSARSQEQIKKCEEVFFGEEQIREIRFHLVLSALSRDNENYETFHGLSVFRPEGIVMTKLDEAVSHGCVYNICEKAKVPLSFFTVGQRFPEDIEIATPERVVSLTLDL